MLTRRAFLAAVPLFPAAAATAEEGFAHLFDGATLAGWTVEEGPESAFYVQDGAIVIDRKSNFPTWLRSEREYENFDFRCDFFMKGWTNSGILLRAARHGNPTDTGLQVNLFHKTDKQPLAESIGAIFPVVAPIRADAAREGEWNSLRILADWPRLHVWINGVLVQDLDLGGVPSLRYRLRRGYLGIESLSYAARFRNLRIRELPGQETWDTLYEQPADLSRWFAAEGKPEIWEVLGPVLRSEGLGYLATNEQYRDFEFHTYMRHARHANGGIIFRADRDPRGGGRRYEIQIHDVGGATYPTGSLYDFRRARYPRVTHGEWFLFQLIVRGDWCLVRIDGEDVMEYKGLTNLEPGHLMLQAHRQGHWIEYKQVRIKNL